MNRDTKKGYMEVEAAIFLPIFIISIITIGYLIKFAFIEENVGAIALDEGRNLMKSSYILPAAPTFKQRLSKRLNETVPEAKETEVCNFRYFYTKNNINDLISYSIEYEIKLNFPIRIVEDYHVKQGFTFRGFTGADNSEETSFDQMLEEKEAETVYVFPRSGERFHREECTYIKSYPRQKILNKIISKSYDPCRLCNAKNAGMGTIVYCFKYGRSYHNAKCKKVVKYVIAMEKAEAEGKGYTACQKCY